MDHVVQPRSPSAWRILLFAGLAGATVSFISVALDAAPTSAAEGDLGSYSLVVDLPASVSEAVGAVEDLSADVPSSPIAPVPIAPDIPAAAETPLPTVGETVVVVSSAVDAIAAAPDAVAPIVSDISDHVAIPLLPVLDLPALPVPALPVPALPVAGLSLATDGLDGPLPEATPSVPLAATLGARSDVDQPSSEPSAASPSTPAASVAPVSAPLGRSDDLPRDTAPPSDVPAQPRSSSAPSGTSATYAADVAGGHPDITTQRAILPSSWAAACHPAPSFDPGSTPD